MPGAGMIAVCRALVAARTGQPNEALQHVETALSQQLVANASTDGSIFRKRKSSWDSAAPKKHWDSLR